METKMEEQKMNKTTAMSIVSQVCGAFKGTLGEHQMIQQAINYLNGLEEKEKVESQSN